MATLFQDYVAEERAEERELVKKSEEKKGIRNMVETYYKFRQDYMLAKDAVIDKYPDVDESLIDDIIAEVYKLVR